MKTTGGNILPGLVTIVEGSNTQLVSTRDNSAINMPSTKQVRAIQGVGGDINEIDKVRVVDTNSIKVSKSVKCKNLVQLKEVGSGFLIYGARLVFI